MVRSIPSYDAVRDYRRLNALLKKIKSLENATIEDLRYYGGCLYFGAHTGVIVAVVVTLTYKTYREQNILE